MNGQDLLKGLNDRQKEAVMHIDGPLLILAGAGSGKTRVITHRTGYLIENGVSPWNILAITFTNKAASEMRERVDTLIGGSDAARVWVSTFHSMCVRMLRQDIEKLGYGRDFTIYDTDDQRSLIKSCIKKLNLDTKVYRDRGILSIISSYKNQLLGADDYADGAADFYDRNVARVFREYEKELKTNNALDFDDLLAKTVTLFNDFPEVLGYWQERFRYIMVDEYQDTNNVQFELVRLLSAKYHNLCVVGDDDQSIYKFRGANIENILNFEKTFPGTRVIKLEQNYRSTSSILDAANAVIRNNKSRKDKTLWTANYAGELPDYHEYDTAAGEAEAIINRALRNVDSGVSLKDQAVLYRTNAQSRLLEEKCISKNVPYIIVGGVNFYQRKEIKDMLSYLRVISNSTDDLSAMRIINVPRRGIGQTSIGKISAFASEQGISFYDALMRCSEIRGLGAAEKRIAAFTEFIRSLRKRLCDGELTLRKLIEAVLEESGYEEELKKEDAVTAEARLENIKELISKAVSYERDADAYGTGDGMEDAGGLHLLSGFLENVSLVADIDRVNDTDQVLTMMTLHSSKGLEFDTVFLSGLEEGLFPSAASINADNPEEEISEERRLCYVGITRARKNLHLSSARERMVNGEVHYMRTSRFVDEIPDNMAVKYFRAAAKKEKPAFSEFGGYEGVLNREQSYGFEGRFSQGAKKSSEERAYSAYNAFNNSPSYAGKFGSLDTSGVSGKKGKSRSAVLKGVSRGFKNVTDQKPIKKLPDYSEGDRVRHFKFGTGTVMDISDEPRDYKVTVAFDGIGTKVMYAGFAKLEKI